MVDRVALAKTAAKAGNFAALKTSLENQGWFAFITGRVTPDDVIEVASENGHLEIVKYLIESGASLENAFTSACWAGDVPIASYLLDKGVNPNVGLRSAASSGRMPTLELLLNAGADPNGEGSSGPLHAAASRGHANVVDLLIERGADINKLTSDGLNVLSVAFDDYNGRKIAKKLASMHPHLLNQVKKNPLLAACLNHWTEDVQWLLEYGANPNIQSSDGDSPLHHAVQGASSQFVSCLTIESNPELKDIVTMLLAAGASTEAKNNRESTPRDELRKLREELPTKLARIGGFLGSTVDAQRESAAYNAKALLASVRLVGASAHASFDSYLSQVDDLLRLHRTTESLEALANKAVTSSLEEEVLFAQVPQLLKSAMESAGRMHPDVATADVVQSITNAFTFECESCGELNSDVIHLAAAVAWSKQDSPDTAVTFTGPNVESVYNGECPQCQSVKVVMKSNTELLEV